MPVYLLRGFRWARQSIRIHVIQNILDDVAPEWLLGPASQDALVNSFNDLHPEIMALIPTLRFIEQYDPQNTTTKNQDFAYVADIVHEINLGADVDELRDGHTPYEQWEALRQLRTKIAPNEKIAWYIVYCGDLERSFSPTSTAMTETFSQGSADWTHAGWGNRSMTSRAPSERPTRQDFNAQRSRRSSITRSFKKVFGGGGPLKTVKSLKDLRKGDRKSMSSGRTSRTSATPPPPLPELRPPGTAH